MRSILRLYLTTSKGNDQFLFKQLTNLQLKPKFDDSLHAFYFDAPMTTMFKIAHRSLITQNMYVQIGQPFPAGSQTVFAQRLEKIQFKNYLPLKRGLIENLTLNILVRQTQYPLSDNVMTSFLHNALQKQIVKRQYFQEVLKGDFREQDLLTYYQMREIVERKWQQEDILTEKQRQLLDYQKQEEIKQIGSAQDSKILTSRKSQTSLTKFQENLNLPEIYLPYQPHLTIYVRRNKVRFLLKVNEQPMYKLGWKKRIGWAPVRQSIATSVLSQSNLFSTDQETVIWDPFCGSGTFGLVAAAMHYGAWVRLDSSNFNWQYWPVYKPQYLQEYFEVEKAEKKDKLNKLKLICTDINFKAANNTIGNLKELEKSLEEINIQLNEKSNSTPLIKRIKPTEHWSQVMSGDWIVGCGDFNNLSENIFNKDRKVNIITNLPYLKARSADHMPLSQLISVYKRFSKMITNNKDKIANVFILIDNNSSNLSHPSHFLSVSEQKWNILNTFESGGMPIALYGWENNQIQYKYQDLSSLITVLKEQVHNLQKVPDEELTTALTKYRRKISEIEKKTYFLPQHLKKIKRGWRRVKQKRRRRHLLRAYDLFAKKRDKMIAFAQYANKKLEIKMLRRGSVWRKRNMRLLTGLSIESLQKELKKQFEGKIQDALQKNQQKEAYRKKRAKQVVQQQKKAKTVALRPTQNRKKKSKKS